MVQRIYPKGYDAPWVWRSDIAAMNKMLLALENKNCGLLCGFLRGIREEMQYMEKGEEPRFHPDWKDTKSINNAVTFIIQAASFREDHGTEDSIRTMLRTCAQRLSKYIGLNVTNP